MFYISIKNLNYSFSSGEVLFENLNLSLSKKEKIAIVGDNGVGKTTLLKIISSEIDANSGNCDISGKIGLMPQFVDFSGTVVEYLDIKEKIDAIRLVSQGVVDDSLFTIIGDDWALESEVLSWFDKFSIPYISLDSSYELLSGGEKIKISLIKVLLGNPDLIVLDEPTNNLDVESKCVLLELLNSIGVGVLMVSHDRQFLNSMDKIYEIKNKAGKLYGGNYDFYKEMKDLELSNLIDQASNISSGLKKDKAKVIAEADSLGKKIKAVNKKAANKKFNPNISSTSQIRQSASNTSKSKEDKMKKSIDHKSGALNDLKQKIKEDSVSFSIVSSQTHAKNLISLDDISFSYGERSIFSNFNLSVVGGQRVLVKGNNGSGKTTLLKIINGQESVSSGVFKSNAKIAYLDQSLSIIDSSKTLLENYIDLNAGATVNKAYLDLASVLFKNKDVEKSASVLSGGERLRLALVSVLGCDSGYDLIILDEPTNNLDLKSIAILEKSLAGYLGALVVVSHDAMFIENLNITKEICISD